MRLAELGLDPAHPVFGAGDEIVELDLYVPNSADEPGGNQALQEFVRYMRPAIRQTGSLPFRRDGNDLLPRKRYLLRIQVKR